MCGRRERSSSRHPGDPRRLDESALAVVIQGIHVVFVFTLVGRLLLFAEKIDKFLLYDFHFRTKIQRSIYKKALTNQRVLAL